MNDTDIEQKLAENGFTAKEIKFITYWVEKERASYTEILRQMCRIFIGMLALRLFFTLITILCFVYSERVEFYGFLVAYIFIMLLSEVFAPLFTGAKIFRYTRKFIL